VAHCLLLELEPATPERAARLALVDTGLGRKDMDFSLQRLGLGMTLGGGASPGTTALEHVQRLGYDPHGVRDILLTHLDKDHTGGLRDFPWAAVHIHPRELATALKPQTFIAHQRYSADHFAHKPRWLPLDLEQGREWRGFPGAVSPAGLPEAILMVPLPGHTPGHCGIAVQLDSGQWLFHCGDAVYHAAWLNPGGRPPLAIQAIEQILQHDSDARRATRYKLAQLIASPDVKVFSSHDPIAFAELQGIE
jgi:glyoxylase-like metal-dependent hydrolase (beta-lactamase superfamily II)